MQYLSKCKVISDANLPFLIDLETKIMEEIRSPERKMQEAGILPQGAPQGPPPGGIGPPPSIGGGGPMGASPMGGGGPMPPDPAMLQQLLGQ